MNKYNEYPIVDLGYSDIATLILVGMTEKGLKTILKIKIGGRI